MVPLTDFYIIPALSGNFETGGQGSYWQRGPSPYRATLLQGTETRQRDACQHGGMISITHPVNNEFIPASREKSNYSTFSGVTSRGNLRRQKTKSKAAAAVSALRFRHLSYRPLQCKNGTHDIHLMTWRACCFERRGARFSRVFYSPCNPKVE